MRSGHFYNGVAMTQTAKTTELVTLPEQKSALDFYAKPNGLDVFIEQIKNKVLGTVYDITTQKGRDECRSDAAKVGRSKTAIEKLGKALSAEYKEIPKKIDAERRRAFDELEALQKQVRQPLTEWEEAEQERQAKHRWNIDWFDGQVEYARDGDADKIRAVLSDVSARIVDEYWEEFEAEAHRAKARALDCLTQALAAREKYEAEQAELAELRHKQAEQERKDREAEIARQAAEKAKADAEAKAQAERDAAAKREADIQAAAERAEREKLEAIERQKQAEARAEAEKLASERRAKEAAEAARQAEIARQEQEKAQAEEERRQREADREHMAFINRAAMQALISNGLPEDCAKQAIVLIAKGVIPNVSINY